MTEETQKTGRMNYCCGGRGGWKFILIPICIAAAVFVFGTVVMYLWNAIIPSIFTSIGPITFWQALGILVLSKILFGGFRGRGGCGGRRWRGSRRAYWSEKWMNMSEEERAKLREEWKCGWGKDKC